MSRIYKKFTNWCIVLVGVLCITIFAKQPISSKDISEPLSEISDNDSVSVPCSSMLVHHDSEISSLIEDYEHFLDKRIEETGTVGAAVVIVHKGKIVFMKPFGLRDIEANDSVDVHTVFRLASVSKGFAGVLAARLHNENIIDINEKIVDILPDFKLKDSVYASELELSHTLSHTTGLVPHAYDDLVELNRPVGVIMDELETVNLAGPPGKYYAYQNVVFSLIDTILKVQTGKSYSTLLREKIFKPLDMQSASTCFQAYKLNYNTAAPHYRYGRGYRRMKDNDRYYSVAPAAGVNASISDMGKWLVALTGHRPDVIDPCTIEMVSDKYVRTPLKWLYLRFWKGAYKKYYGLGWRIVKYKGREVMYHGGYVNGYRAEIAFSLKDDIGIAFLMNSPNRLASESLPKFLSAYFNYIDKI